MSYDSMKHYGESVRRNNAIAEAEKKLKLYGWGIVDKDGKPVLGATIRIHSEPDGLEELTKIWGDRDKSSFRVVQLFYKDES